MQNEYDILVRAARGRIEIGTGALAGVFDLRDIPGGRIWVEAAPGPHPAHGLHGRPATDLSRGPPAVAL